MTNTYKVKLLKDSELSSLERQLNEIINQMSEEGYNLKEIKQLVYDKYAGYIIVIVFYKLK